MIPDQLTGTINETYAAGLDTVSLPSNPSKAEQICDCKKKPKKKKPLTNHVTLIRLLSTSPDSKYNTIHYHHHQETTYFPHSSSHRKKLTFQPHKKRGAYAVVDPHNFGRYYEEVITDVEGFGAWWSKVAARYVDNELVIFDTNNEYHDMDNTLVYQLNQAAVDAIRDAGATTQYIFVEGNSWSGAWHWVRLAPNPSISMLTNPLPRPSLSLNICFHPSHLTD